MNLPAWPRWSFCLLFLIACLLLALAFSSFAGLYRNALVNLVLQNAAPFLRGFNWGRFSFLNRTIFYLAFMAALVILLHCKHAKALAYLLACAQIAIILTANVPYNYAYLNLNHSRLIREDSQLSYREFYSETLFEGIKSDIQYQGEGIVSVGYHPNVTLYNGFSTLDGYNSTYPLRYMRAFREIIAPELEENAERREYYDKWGGRMYLYNREIDFAPSRERPESPINLLINVEALRNLGGKYVFSRAEIGNHDSLGLKFVRDYDDAAGPYHIFVYSL
jgi:hypothetical protein